MDEDFFYFCILHPGISVVLCVHYDESSTVLVLLSFIILLLFKFYYLYAFLIFFQGETNQGNQKIYQRTVGRKIFMLFHINLNPFSMNVFKTFFLIACFWFFPYFMGNIFIFYVYLSTHNFFYTLFL